mmetsp:Transcript_148137/g.475756  ORF Transcript_148137/g.475756 Transcript_148137/m.475756 type:complete len:259 (-) Transcript_148137:1903-2679(-)
MRTFFVLGLLLILGQHAIAAIVHFHQLVLKLRFFVLLLLLIRVLRLGVVEPHRGPVAERQDALPIFRASYGAVLFLAQLELPQVVQRHLLPGSGLASAPKQPQSSRDDRASGGDAAAGQAGLRRVQLTRGSPSGQNDGIATPAPLAQLLRQCGRLQAAERARQTSAGWRPQPGPDRRASRSVAIQEEDVLMEEGHLRGTCSTALPSSTVLLHFEVGDAAENNAPAGGLRRDSALAEPAASTGPLALSLQLLPPDARAS